MPRRQCLLRYFKCPVCGAILTAPRRHGHTHPGHVKTMYCFVCRQERDFVQTDSERSK